MNGLDYYHIYKQGVSVLYIAFDSVIVHETDRIQQKEPLEVDKEKYTKLLEDMLTMTSGGKDAIL